MKRSLLIMIVAVGLLLAVAAPALAFPYDGYCYNYFNTTGSGTFYWRTSVSGSQEAVVGSLCDVEYQLYDGNGFFTSPMYGYGTEGFVNTFDYFSGTHYNAHMRVTNLHYSGTSSRIHASGQVYQN